MRKLVQAFAIVGIFSVLGFACMGAAHAATAPPDPEADAGGFIRLLYEAATSKQWSIVAGYVLVGLAFVVRKYALGRFIWTQTRWGGFGIAVALSLIVVVAPTVCSEFILHPFTTAPEAPRMVVALPAELSITVV